MRPAPAKAAQTASRASSVTRGSELADTKPRIMKVEYAKPIVKQSSRTQYAQPAQPAPPTRTADAANDVPVNPLR